MSELVKHINRLCADELHNDRVVKVLKARDLVSCFPVPENMRRDLNLVPNVDVRLHLSNSPRLPVFISDFISKFEDTNILGEDNLLGLCLNGRQMSPEIFIHAAKLFDMDHTGNLFDEIVWHEKLHAVEGFSVDGAERGIPWSYKLQQEMKSAADHDPFQNFNGSEDYGDDLRDYIKYLHTGTKVQENVSEIFARVGVLYLKEIRNTGTAPQPEQAVQFFNQILLKQDFNEVASNWNAWDLAIGLQSHSTAGQDIFWDHLPEMIENISGLYGCRPA